MSSIQAGNCVFEPLENGTLSLSEYHGAGGEFRLPSLVDRIPVSEIDADAFNHGGAITSFSVSDDHPFFSARDGILYTKDGTALVRYPFGRREESCTVPEGVTDLRHYAFAEARSLKSVLLPASLEGMGSHAFTHCEALELVRLSDRLCRMGRSIFRGCVSLTDIDISPDHPVFRMDGPYFVNLAERSLILCLPALAEAQMSAPENLRQVDEFAFYHCDRLESIRLHHGLRSIGRYAFYHLSNLRECVLPSTLRSIGSRAFSGCSSLKELEIPDNVTSIEYKAFNNCDKLTLLVNKHSYADRYCRQFNFPCRHPFHWPWQK